jgi:hypothetical protein
MKGTNAMSRQLTRSRQLALAASALSIILAASHAASAQVVAYRHRSTVWGDHLAGASELVRAQGAFLRDYADAAEQWVRAEAANDQLWYQRVEYRHQVRMMNLEYLKAKAEARREREATKTADDRAAAAQLWQQARQGGASWPAALKRPEYASSMALIDSILNNWQPNDAASGAMYRRALATEAGVLRTRIADNSDIDFLSRVEAVETLRQLQNLAETPTADLGSQVAMR